MSKILKQSFFARDALEVAPALLGQVLVGGGVRLKITEVEAYCHPVDSANHCRFGKTPRNAPMWGPAGFTYVYLCYGIHSLLNISTNQQGEGAAVLIRAAEPLAGLEQIKKRRGKAKGVQLLNGPGKVTQALGADVGWTNLPVFKRGGIKIMEGDRPERILRGPRIGIDYATPEHQKAPWRFAIADSPWVSHLSLLK